MSLFTSIQPKQKIESLELHPEGFKIQARNTGIIAALLAAMNIGAKSFMEVDARGATLKSTSFSGQTRTYVPLNHASATVYRYGSPPGLLAGAGVFAAMGFPSLFDAPMVGGVFMVVALLFVALYAFGPKAVVIGLVSDAGTGESLRLEAKGEQLSELQRVADWLENAVADAGASPMATPVMNVRAADSSPKVVPTGHTVHSHRSL